MVPIIQFLCSTFQLSLILKFCSSQNSQILIYNLIQRTNVMTLSLISDVAYFFFRPLLIMILVMHWSLWGTTGRCQPLLIMILVMHWSLWGTTGRGSNVLVFESTLRSLWKLLVQFAVNCLHNPNFKHPPCSWWVVHWTSNSLRNYCLSKDFSPWWITTST